MQQKLKCHLLLLNLLHWGPNVITSPHINKTECFYVEWNKDGSIQIYVFLWNKIIVQRSIEMIKLKKKEERNISLFRRHCRNIPNTGTGTIIVFWPHQRYLQTNSWHRFCKWRKLGQSDNGQIKWICHKGTILSKLPSFLSFFLCLSHGKIIPSG